MELTLAEEQAAVRATFARLFERESTPARVRAAEAAGIDHALWGLLVESGLPTLAVPARAGGGGGSVVDLSLVVGEQGRCLGTVPLVETAVAARLVARLESSDLVDEIAGGMRAALALHPAVDGVVRLVPSGRVVDLVIALDGPDLVAVRRDPGQVATYLPSIGHAAVADWSVGESRASERRVLASNGFATELWGGALDEWKVLQAALLAGLGRGALDLAVGYARERRQFGAPIGSFQALAHRLADASVRLDGAELLARHAAWLVEHDPTRRESAAAMAFADAAQAAQLAVKDGLHVFGGYGFMLEYDIQLYFQRAKAWTLVYGAPAGELEKVGRLVAAEASG